MIFISYRREDSVGHAGRIFDRLAEQLGRDQVCRDIDSLPPGEDFVLAIKQIVERSDVLLALIGPRWITATDDEGHWRLANEDDPVRLEIVTALQNNVRVVPVLLQGARMPKAKDLPGDLASLAHKNAVEIRDTSFDQDVSHLLHILAPAWRHKLLRIVKRRPVYVPAFVLAATLIGIWAYPYLVVTPEKLRIQIVQMGLAYDADSFVERAMKNDERAVDLFLRAGMLPDTPDRRDRTALMAAVSEGHLSLAKRLVEKGANVNRALSWSLGHAEIFKYLLAQKPSHDAINTALLDGSYGDRPELMQTLLDAGADVNFQKGDVTPLSEAARGLNVAGVQLLLSRGANVNPDFREGWLPLHHAADAISAASPSQELQQKQLEIVQALLAKGANMELRARSMVQWQPTPLLLAIDKERSRVALLLIERGADVNTKTIDPGGNERTALMWAAAKGLDEVVRALIAKGAAVNAPNNVGDTALMVAADGNGANFGRNQPTVVRTLLKLGADIEARNARGLTSLMRAAPTDTDVLTALLEAGASVNVTSGNGWTALMVAAAYGNVKNIKFLLNKGADLRLRNKDGDDAMALATKAGHKEAALLFTTYAATGKAALAK